MRIVNPIATTEPNAISSTMMATPIPMSSLLGARLHDLGERAGELRLHAGRAGGDRRRCRVVELRDGELGHGVRDVDVRRLSVGTDRGRLRSERIGDAGNGMAGRQLLASLLDGRLV